MTRTLAAAALVLAAVAPVSGYHIDGNLSAAGLVGSGDWTVATPVLILCESNGPGDDRNANPDNNPGNGGLCTTGRNDVTGLFAPLVKPAATVWTQIDACDDTTLERNFPALPPYTAPAPCPLTSLTNVAYTLELGTMSCTVLPAEAAVYNESYAWLTFDGDGTYTTPDDTPGGPHGGDGDVLGTDELSLPGFQDRASAWHGHVAMFVDVSASIGTVDTGSAYTTTPAAGFLTTATACDGAGLVGPNAGIVKV